MRWSKLKSQFLVCLFCWLLVASAASQPQYMSTTEVSSTIKEKLIDLKANSAAVTAQLETLQETLKASQSKLEASQSEVEEWRTKSTQLSDSLMNINEELSRCYETITVYETKLKFRAKVISILIALCVLRLLLVLLSIILRIKGIVLPTWFYIIT